MSIPRKLWQGWIGPKPIPDREKAWCAQMARMNPTWQHTLFGNETLERYGSDPYVKALMDAGKPWAFVTDRIRVLLLRDEGGIWLDPDCQPVRPFDTLSHIWDSPQVTFVFGLRSPHRPNVALHRGVTLADNTFMASTANSRLIRRIEALWSPKNIVVNGHDTGVEVLANLDGHTDALLSYRYFYDLQTSPDTIVLHDAHNLGSWVEETKAEQRARLMTPATV